MRLRTAYLFVRIAASLCIVGAIGGALAQSKLAGPLLLAGLGLFSVGPLMNVYAGFAKGRVYLYSREVTKDSEPALFRLWFNMSVLFSLIAIVAAFAILSAKVLL